MISTVVVDGWFTENLISTVLVDGWFTENLISKNFWLMAGSLKT